MPMIRCVTGASRIPWHKSFLKWTECNKYSFRCYTITSEFCRGRNENNIRIFIWTAQTKLRATLIINTRTCTLIKGEEERMRGQRESQRWTVTLLTYLLDSGAVIIFYFVCGQNALVKWKTVWWRAEDPMVIKSAIYTLINAFYPFGFSL